MQGPLGPTKGKDSAITVGPWFVSADELAERRRLDLEMSWPVNGHEIGDDRLDSMAWGLPT